MSLTFTEIQSAADRIKSGVVRTPCLESEALSRRLGTSVVVKYENLQHTGAFKARRALSRLLLLSEEGETRGVVAMSTGNHAHGLACQAGPLGIPATIVMHKGTPFVKVRKTAEYGAGVELQGKSLEEAATFTQTQAQKNSSHSFIHTTTILLNQLAHCLKLRRARYMEPFESDHLGVHRSDAV